MAVANRLGRSQAFVSERTDGTRPVDTDIIVAVAKISGTDPRSLVSEILTRMGGAAGTKRSGSGQVPSRPAHADSPASVRGSVRTRGGHK